MASLNRTCTETHPAPYPRERLRTADSAEPFHYDTMADETIAVLEAIGGPSHIVGWSDGGNIELIVAIRRPDLVKRLVVIGSNFRYDGIDLSRGGIDLISMTINDQGKQGLFGDYASNSPDGPSHYDMFIEKTLKMWASEPNLTLDDLSTIKVPVLVLVGDHDWVHWPHTIALHENISGAQLAVVPGAGHAVPLQRPDKVAQIIDDFLTQ